jgi:hypothetical protein
MNTLELVLTLIGVALNTALFFYVLIGFNWKPSRALFLAPLGSIVLPIFMLISFVLIVEIILSLLCRIISLNLALKILFSVSVSLCLNRSCLFQNTFGFEVEFLYCLMGLLIMKLLLLKSQRSKNSYRKNVLNLYSKLFLLFRLKLPKQIAKEYFTAIYN